VAFVVFRLETDTDIMASIKNMETNKLQQLDNLFSLKNSIQGLEQRLLDTQKQLLDSLREQTESLSKNLTTNFRKLPSA
jgi:predicted phage-related endonuclease